MNTRTESTISFLAAILVLGSAMLDPRLSAGLAAIFLVTLGAYKLFDARRATGRS